MLTRILFLADVSPFSDHALAWAKDKMRAEQTDFLLLHVVDSAAGLESPRLVSEAEAYLDRLGSHILSPESYYKTMVLSGDIMEILPEVVQSEGCTFVLLPIPKGMDPFPLIRTVPVPQMVVQEEDEFFPPGDIFQKVVVALDLEPARTSLMLENLRTLLLQTGGNPFITLAHAFYPPTAESAPELMNAASEALGEIQKEVSSWGYDTAVELVTGKPETDLPPRINAMAPTLLALGLPYAGEMGQLVLGATAEALLQETVCPLLLFPL